MKVPRQSLLARFVDRTQEVSEFQKLLEQSPSGILCLHGPGGIGKSAVLSRMMDECEKRGIRWIHIEWEDSRRYNYLDVMRRIRDGTEPAMFQLFNDRVNFYTVPEYALKISLEGAPIQNVEVLAGGEIRSSEVTVHVGHSLEIRDLMVNVPRPDRCVTDAEIVIESTNAFMPCLRGFAAEHPLVVFFDALEKADPLARKWICDELLRRVRDEEITNVFVVLASREHFELDPSFFDCMSGFELQPFRIDDVFEYLTKRGVDCEKRLAEFIFANSERGNPLKIAVSVDNFVRLQDEQRNE